MVPQRAIVSKRKIQLDSNVIIASIQPDLSINSVFFGVDGMI